MKLEQVGKEIGPFRYGYDWIDVILYHLGIGECGTGLDLIYEGVEGDLNFCPSFAVVTILEPLMEILKLTEVDLTTVRRAEQSIIMNASIPPKGALVTKARASNVYDKDKGAFLEVDTETTDEAGHLLFTTCASIFGRGTGDLGSEREKREFGFGVSQKSQDDQAALYRLSGDTNPLHTDLSLTGATGFSAPILHGLCAFVFAVRAVLEEVSKGDAARMKELGMRSSNPFFPGDTITIRGWKVDEKCVHLAVSA